MCVPEQQTSASQRWKVIGTYSANEALWTIQTPLTLSVISDRIFFKV